MITRNYGDRNPILFNIETSDLTITPAGEAQSEGGGHCVTVMSSVILEYLINNHCHKHSRIINYPIASNISNLGTCKKIGCPSFHLEIKAVNHQP
jgi:hypothetical protein